MSSKPQLFFTSGSCALASLAALEQVGEPYLAVRLQMQADGAGGEGYEALNGRRQVPALRREDRVIRETGAILLSLARRFPDAQLLPADPEGEIRAAEWLGYLGGTLHPAFRPLVRPRRFVGDQPDAIRALQSHSQRYLADRLLRLEAEVADRDWLLGEPSALDGYLHVFTSWSEQLGAPLGPGLRRHHERTAALPALQRARAREMSAPLSSL